MIAWVRLVLLLPGLRRLSTAMRSTQEVGAAATAVKPHVGRSEQRVGTPVTGLSMQPYGEPHEPRPRVGTTGHDVWLVLPEREA